MLPARHADGTESMLPNPDTDDTHGRHAVGPRHGRHARRQHGQHAAGPGLDATLDASTDGMLPDPDTDAALDNCTVGTLLDPTWTPRWTTARRARCQTPTWTPCSTTALLDLTWTPCSTTALLAYCRTPLLDDSTLGGIHRRGRLAARLPLDNDSEGLLTKPNGGGTLDDRTHGMLADPAAADLPADVMLVDGKAPPAY
ncbi:hypothetical protein PHYSODRAFT_256291 [Phytophthora sojae]|uniref:Uncharacterized protein n=1 Tax=Phytophthora sojae (strain P6497) TaxID=1094619 RepID=G4Z5M7_PHYSP|nr:hypothetical protein PHYSODRAFT_256291 [Phytophthora sojae]EGZ22341.1 hypothetical protein PHYSODRAFT_256291 [Phytophthora sojae]|eukprot:XP_009525058.1 hypothetical protein PHYSODRAFT_256291 [Phytophthora sojae]